MKTLQSGWSPCNILSEEEWNEALEAISGTENGQHIWIGATDTERGDWKWVTGEPWSWSNWRQTGNQNLMAVHVRTGVSLIR